MMIRHYSATSLGAIAAAVSPVVALAPPATAEDRDQRSWKSAAGTES